MSRALADFTLVDLLSQYDAVQQYVHGWSAERILRWFSRFGRIEILDLPNLDTETLVLTYPGLRPDMPRYAFIPPSRLATLFYFTEDQRLCVGLGGRWGD
jgi:hypothetical protein